MEFFFCFILFRFAICQRLKSVGQNMSIFQGKVFAGVFFFVFTFQIQMHLKLDFRMLLKIIRIIFTQASSGKSRRKS